MQNQKRASWEVTETHVKKTAQKEVGYGGAYVDPSTQEEAGGSL